MPVEIVGRDAELGALTSFVDGLPLGPRALVLRGEAGAGKTTLFDAAVQRAGELGALMLVARPAESDAPFSFSGLGDLLESRLDDALGSLPAPQRRALRVALLLDEAPELPPEPHAVAAAVKSVLRVLAQEGAVLVAIDDVQWLDAPTAEAVAYALRRVEREPIGALCAERSDRHRARLPLGLDRSRLPTELVEVGGLSLGALHALLRSRLGTPFPRPVLTRIASESGGNPFIALELARALKRRGDLHVAPGALPVPETIADLLRERLEALPSRTLEALRAVALMADPTEDQALAVTRDPSALEAAAAAGVLELAGRRVRFSHPLLASAVATGTPPGRRRELHSLLSTAVSDPEERARHLALAADGPSEAACEELESAAALAGARGAPASAAELLMLALPLTEPGSVERGWRRKRQAADYLFLAGETRAARVLLEELVEAMPRGPERARALASLAWAREDDFGASARLLDEARDEAGDDPALLAAVYLMRSDIVAIRGDSFRARDDARLALAAAERAGDVALLASCLAQVLEFDGICGEPVDDGQLEHVLALERHIRTLHGRTPPSYVAGSCYLRDGRLDEARAAFEAALARAEAEGVENWRADTLLRLSVTEARAGNLELADEYARTGLEVAEQAGMEQLTSALLCGCAFVALLRGRADEARATAQRGLELSLATGDQAYATSNEALLGLIDFATGAYERAADRLWPLRDRLELLGRRPSPSRGLLATTVEALVAAGRVDEAQAALTRLERQPADPVEAALVRHCRGVLAAAQGRLAEARAALEEALGLLEALPLPLERARALVALGAVLRRLKERRAARAALGEALEAFERLGMPLWAARAREELARIGGRTPGDALTTTERRVAELAARGSSNKEIAAALFVTVKTVEATLSRVYRKLGVRSRAALGRALGGQTVGEPPLPPGSGAS